MSEVTIADLQEQRALLEQLQERRNMALKLSRNPEFKKLILQEFCVEECAKYAQLSADPALTPAQQADCLGIAQASGHLRRWLQVISQMAAKAENDIVAIDSEIAELRAEGDS